MEGVGGVGEIDNGRDADDAAECDGGAGSQVAGEFEDEVAAHGVADKRDRGEVFAIAEEAKDGEDVI